MLYNLEQQALYVRMRAKIYSLHLLIKKVSLFAFPSIVEKKNFKKYIIQGVMTAIQHIPNPREVEHIHAHECGQPISAILDKSTWLQDGSGHH